MARGVAFTLIELPVVRKREAFTLIELLVVVAIITVLLALLVPGLDKAVYQAELAACGANLKGIATGVTTYAAQHRRSYPYRRDVQEVPQWQNSKFFDPIIERDIRRVIRDYVAIKAFIDPMCKKVDFTLEGLTHGYGPYSEWFGWFFRGPGERGMNRLGDRFTWTDSKTDPARPVQYAFDLLVSDWDFGNLGAQMAGAHPDHDGLMYNYTRDNEDQEISFGITVAAPINKMSETHWQTLPGQGLRGVVDTNFASADGSVRRYDRVRWDEAMREDRRMVRVPWQSDNQHGETQVWTHLPLP